ncbi:NAD-dependent epimerase/dehydratase family protein [Pseudohoeflea coraliihabitans]|uniref:NAD(P)-dependent oxidoreductase n=1 Tax=Pseudohoeflea coraliihabitans TaxID=2860393 RepID=A0ABS6WK30_9HYPH|nr:NAD(P)-dependent oxidoreductase [Pseudohoeflea sp. DP4N28-3]MBW3096306.1 NAD(P)-dependent oxidoreductase [Pseudohoeflea sp. DP4N28-3]
MKRVLVSGATGLVGRYIVDHLLQHGFQVVVGGRTPPPSGVFRKALPHRLLALDPDSDQSEAFTGIDHFVHAAFSHLPGRYRGGEGDDPEGFCRANRAGTLALFEAARRAGVRRLVFLSSRAVYDGVTPGSLLREDAPLAPTSLYGQVKLEAETALAALRHPGFDGVSLRATGVYGDLVPNKWQGLIADYLAGRPVPARAASEVHGRDLAAAIVLLLAQAEPGEMPDAVNVSDILVDTRDILAPFQSALGVSHPLPPAGDPNAVSVMSIERLARLGWQPGGRPLFDRTMAGLAARWPF